MTTQDLIANYTPVGDMITVVTSLVLLFVIAKSLYYAQDRKFQFLKRSLHFILGGSICNIAFYLMIKNGITAPAPLIIIRDVYHISYLCCLYCYILYMNRMLDIKGKIRKVILVVTGLMFSCSTILDLLSPVTGFGFNYKDGVWSDSIVSPYNMCYLYSLIVFVLLVVICSKRMIRSVRVCFIVAELVVIAIMSFQGWLNINTFTGFTYLIPILVVMILLHSKPYDDKTGSLGANSYDTFIQRANQKGLSFDYMVLKLNITVIDQMPDELGKVLNSFWYDSFKQATLFSLSNDLYVLAIPRIDKNKNVVEKMDSVIRYQFHSYYEKYSIAYKIIMLYDIDFIENADDLRGMLHYLLFNMEDNTIYKLDDEAKERVKLYKKIRKHLADIEETNDLDDPRVLVYTQPIRNMKTGKYDTAEALMRLELPEIGFVMPGMFISLAEQYNHVHALSKIMLNKVCKEIKRLENEGYKFSRISVNYTASEVRMDRFCEEIINTIKENGISPSKVGIELTESQTESDFKLVKDKIKTLKDAGLTVYLDDIGTGYSNLDRIVRYEVDVVKFDRFFLLEAEKSNKVVKMMNHLSAAFRELDYKLLYEGVETNGHEELCLECGADYIQGFKYAKPIPIEELRSYYEK